jgi:5,10-methenyltetrahydrofolate synthetase
MNKSELRKHFLSLRDNLKDTPKLTELSEQIWTHLYSTDEYKLCKNLLVYAAIGSEPRTGLLIERALADGKAVYCPQITGKEMDFYRIFNKAELIPNGKYNIPEPPKTAERLFIPDKFQPTIPEHQSPAADTISIVPALCVDEMGYRLGYGGGYYDRYFRKDSVNSHKIIPICAIFSVLCIKRFPNEPQDIPVKMIITEKEIKRIGGQNE